MRFLRVLLALSAPAAAVRAQPEPDLRPPPDRIDEDWTFLRNPALRTELVDPLKFIPLSSDGMTSLTLGGEARYRWEKYHNDAWGAVPDDKNGYHLIRLMLHADLRFGSRWRTYVDLKSGLVEGKSAPVKPPERDDLDLHQAFVEWRAPVSGVPLVARVGRQELNNGGARVLAARDGPNVRPTYDAALLRTQPGKWKIDALFARPAETVPGTFDDRTDRQQLIYGFYAVTPLAAIKGAHLDLYYLGYSHDRARLAGGVGDERRHSVGARFWGNRGSLDYNFEVIGQGGDFRDEQIRAWTFFSDTGYTVAAAPTAPRLYLKANIISGDRDPRDGRIGTFNLIYPRGTYFGDIGLVGPANLINLHPGIGGKFSPRWSYALDTVFYWRESTADGVYSGGGALIRPPGRSTARSIGTQSDASVTWTYDRRLSAEATYAHFWAGEFLRETGRHETVSYFSLLTRYRF